MIASEYYKAISKKLYLHSNSVENISFLFRLKADSRMSIHHFQLNDVFWLMSHAEIK